jgi:hypothetical protein
MANTTIPPLPFTTTPAFDLGAIEQPDGLRDERVRLRVPRLFRIALDGLQRTSDRSLTAVGLYALRLGQARLDQLPTLATVDERYGLLLSGHYAHLLCQLPDWSCSFPDSRSRLTFRYAKAEDGAWAERRDLALGLTKGELFQAAFLAGIVDAPIGHESKMILTWHLRQLMLYFKVRADLLAECLERAKYLAASGPKALPLKAQG